MATDSKGNLYVALTRRGLQKLVYKECRRNELVTPSLHHCVTVVEASLHHCVTTSQFK